MPERRPPSFDEARNLRQKARAAGMNPDYWYAVELEKSLKPGKVINVRFWGRDIAVFRGEDGRLAAVEDRCAHRQIKLSLGQVHGCNLVCPYHGWTYNQEGRCVEIPHDLFGRDMPNFRLASFPVKTRYGLIWIFPGDPALAEERKIPDIPELEGPDRWACVPFSYDWNSHHSMIFDNLSDLSHGYLHREHRGFLDPKLKSMEARGDSVYTTYEVRVGQEGFAGYFVDSRLVNNNEMALGYDYPYQWSNTGDKIKHYCFLLPLDEKHTRIFFLFYFDMIRLPFTPWHIPQRLMPLVLRFSNHFFIKPLTSQDGEAVAWEQEAYDEHSGAPPVEMNPAVKLFQELTVRKWEEHLAKSKPRSAAAKEAR